MNKKIFSANAIKWIALAIMFIDHIGAGILERGFIQVSHTAYAADYFIRAVGRISFPLYAFLLVEGYMHTSSRLKYCLRMALFCIISEIPFDYCFFGRITWDYQNVFFTLLMGLLAMCISGYFVEKAPKEAKVIINITAFAAMAVIAELLHTDYGAIGVALIFLFFIHRESRKAQCLTGGLLFIIYEPPCFVAFFLIFLYNGIKKKDINKFVYYALYPAHLTLYYFIHEFLTARLL